MPEPVLLPNYQQGYAQAGQQFGEAIAATGTAIDDQKKANEFAQSMNDIKQFKVTMGNVATHLMGNDYTDEEKQAVMGQIKTSQNPKEIASWVAEFKMQRDSEAQARKEYPDAVLPKPEFGARQTWFDGLKEKALAGPKAMKAQRLAEGGPQPIGTAGQQDLDDVNADKASTQMLAAKHPNIPPPEPGQGAAPPSSQELNQNFPNLPTIPPAANTAEASGRMAAAGIDPNSPEAKPAIAQTENRQTSAAMQPIGSASNQRQAVAGAIQAQHGEMSKTAELAAKTVPTEQQLNQDQLKQGAQDVTKRGQDVRQQTVGRGQDLQHQDRQAAIKQRYDAAKKRMATALAAHKKGGSSGMPSKEIKGYIDSANNHLKELSVEVKAKAVEIGNMSDEQAQTAKQEMDALKKEVSKTKADIGLWTELAKQEEAKEDETSKNVLTPKKPHYTLTPMQ